MLYCDLAHELLQLGDDHEALRMVDEDLTRCARLNNLRLLSALLINRIICLTSLGRSAEALPTIHRVLNLPADVNGRGTMSAHFESMAIAALRAQQPELGAELVALALQRARTTLPDEQLELAVARAELSRSQADLPQALGHLHDVGPLAGDRPQASAPERAAYNFKRWPMSSSNWATASRRLPACAPGSACTSSARTWPRGRVTKPPHCRPNCCGCARRCSKRMPAAAPPNARGPSWRRPTSSCRRKSTKCSHSRSRCASRSRKTF